ncbi:MAG TPA: hypothetical protein VGM27_16155 [Acidobacteriaceae bacterium]
MRHHSAPARSRSVRVQSAAAPHTAAAPALHFQIGRITAEGFTRGDQKRFESSLRSSLAELAHAHNPHEWSASAGLKVSRLDGGRLRPGASPEEAARQIANRIFATLRERPGGTHHA